MRCPEPQLLDRVAAHAGNHSDIEAITTATHAVLSVLGAYLTPAIRELVAAELCPSLGAIVIGAEAGTALPIQEHVLTPEMTVARADELIASVFTVLAEELSVPTLERLRRHLPAPLARSLIEPSVAVRTVTISPRRETLAEGRPGSHRPLSAEAHPSIQQDSVVADNPHGDVKLSSAVGSTQQREHETLAEGRAGANQPLAETRK